MKNKKTKFQKQMEKVEHDMCQKSYKEIDLTILSALVTDELDNIIIDEMNYVLENSKPSGTIRDKIKPFTKSELPTLWDKWDDKV